MGPGFRRGDDGGRGIAGMLECRNAGMSKCPNDELPE
jgi:hypothetical protein